MPAGASVTFLGDGEFDGTKLQADPRRSSWLYVCRTAASIRINAYSVSFRLGLLARRGELLAVTPAFRTTEQYGPVSILAIWEHSYKQTLYLVTNAEL